MLLISLLVIPILIGLIGLVFSKGRITFKEFLVIEGSVLLVVGLGYAASRWRSTWDTEVWSGRVTGKEQVMVSCSHSHPCRCHDVCTGSGKDRSCSTECDTCYDHSYDYDWMVRSNIGDFEIDRIDRQGVETPPRWSKVYVGEPVADSHSYTNYIKASPGSVLRRIATADTKRFRVPPYPIHIYDYYRCNRFIPVGYSEQHSQEWNWLLSELNGDVGPTKQANVIVVAVKNSDSSYEYALEEAWIGGKKNDIVMLLGVPEYPKISWARVISWSTSEDMKVELRDDVLKIGTMERRDDIMVAIRRHVTTQFVRRQMKDFEYLMAGIQPGPVATIFLFLLGVGLTVGLVIYFYREDPFGSRGYLRY